MQSKTSSFNKTLFLINLKRFWPLWVLTTFAGLMVPMFEFIDRYSGTRFSYDMVRANYLDYAASMIPAVIIVYAIFVAMAVWNYLFQTKSVNQFHSMPITRTGLFVTNFISGLTILFIPFVIAGTLEIVVLTVLGGFAFKEILIIIAVTLVEGFFFFAFATLIAFITGNVLALPVLYVIFNFLSIGFEYIINIWVAKFIPGYPSLSKIKFIYLSPVCGLYSKIRTQYTYTYIEPTDYSYGYTDRVYDNISILNLNILWGYLVAAVAITLVALFVYKKSESENAGNVIAFRPLRKPILYVYTVGSALAGAELLYTIFSSFNAKYYKLGVFIFLIVLSGSIAYFVGLMLLDKTTRVFTKKNFGPLVGVLGFLVISTVLIKADVLDLYNKMPSRDDIESVKVAAQYDELLLFDGKDDALIDAAMNVHKAILANKDTWINWDRSMWDENTDYTRFEVVYTLKNGKELHRTYNSLPVRRDRVNDKNTYDYSLCHYVSLPEYMGKEFEEIDGKKEIDHVYVDKLNQDGSTLELYGRDAKDFVDALVKDISLIDVPEDKLYDYFIRDEYYYSGIYAEICFENESETFYKSWKELRIKDDYVNLTSLCIERGWITEEELDKAMHQGFGPKDYVY